MPIEIQIPRLGWSMDEGIFNGWLKKDGDSVKGGEPLFTLEGEKAAQDIESTDDGLLRIAKDSPQAGDTVIVGRVIGYLVDQNEIVESHGKLDEKFSAEKEIQQQETSKADFRASPVNPGKPKTEITNKSGLPASSPRARRRAVELGIEINHLEGSGSSGRIIEADVLSAPASRAIPAPAAEKSMVAPALAGLVSTMRRNIAERTVLSFTKIPHFYVRAEMDATDLLKTREHLVDILENKFGVRITLTDFILRAQALALREFPVANAVWQNNGIVNFVDADVGIVVGLTEGLVIPVIRAAQKLSFVQLAMERARLVEAVRKGQFNAEMLTGGASSISNLGTTRTDEFAAIIAPHQSSMLAVGRAAPRPYVVDGHLQVRTTIRLCLSVDHRILDGSPAAGFLGKIVELLENPSTLVDNV